MIGLLFCGSMIVFAQSAHQFLGDAIRLNVAETISAEDLNIYLSTLASEEFEGRETGQPGQKKAAAYIADFFKTNGLLTPNGQENYFQEINFLGERWTKIQLHANNKTYRHLWDYYAYPSTNASVDTAEINEILFLGYGIEDEKYNDYEGVDSLNGKTVLVFDGEPMNADSISVLTGTDSLSNWSSDWRMKLKVAKKYGAQQVLIIDRNFKENLAQARKEILNTRLRMRKGENPAENYPNNVFITTNLLRDMVNDSIALQKIIDARDQVNAGGKLEPVSFATSIVLNQQKRTRSIASENVLGIVEGSDPNLKEEMIIVSGHYDHLGKRGDNIYYGANDNGSGTSAVLEIAQAIAKAKAEGNGPRRTILFMLFAGEEKGLLGSKYYVTYPIYDLKDAVANVNIDMVGRVDDIYQDSVGMEHIYVIGADRLSTELHDINEEMNKNYTKIKLDYRYNEESDPNRYYYRSDHYNFAEQNIPIIFYFNGTHEDYHRISDTVDKIDFDRLENVAKLAFHTVWQLANQDRRIVVDKIEKEDK
jgi:hypothetical protein